MTEKRVIVIFVIHRICSTSPCIRSLNKDELWTRIILILLAFFNLLSVEFIELRHLLHMSVFYLRADILGEVLEQELVFLAEALLSHSHRDVQDQKQRRELRRLGRGQVE